MTENISTDVWGRWVQTNGDWNFTDLPKGSHYPEGTTCKHTQTCFSAHTHTQLEGLNVYRLGLLQNAVQTVTKATVH